MPSSVTFLRFEILCLFPGQMPDAQHRLAMTMPTSPSHDHAVMASVRFQVKKLFLEYFPDHAGPRCETLTRPLALLNFTPTSYRDTDGCPVPGH